MSQQTQTTNSQATTNEVPTTNEPGTSQAQSTAQQTSGLDFIPESYRQSSWASKYTTPEDFFKGVDHMNKMMGQKQIVQGLQIPGEAATEEDWNNFYSQSGRPESADKYTYAEDIKAFDGLDLDGEKKVFGDLAHRHGLSQKQASGLFKDYISNLNQGHESFKENLRIGIGKASELAFGAEGADAGYELAKKGAIALGIQSTLDKEGLSANPIVLKLCAKLGELSGEDSLIREGQDLVANSSLLEEAKRLQMSAEYRSGNKETQDRVAEIYKKVYPN